MYETEENRRKELTLSSNESALSLLHDEFVLNDLDSAQAAAVDVLMRFGGVHERLTFDSYREIQYTPRWINDSTVQTTVSGPASFEQFKQVS